jgi:protein-S-isoprenylcysteine O-methyltransferase Ste14
MTFSLTSASGRTGATCFYAGWAGFALFGTVAYLEGNADVSYAVFHIVVAAALCAWFAKTTGRAAPIVGAVLGTLYLLQMIVFVSSGFSSDDPGSVTTRIADGAGLLAAVLTLLGAGWAIRRRRSPALDQRRATTA